MTERQPFRGETRRTLDAGVWAIACCEGGWILNFTVATTRSKAIAKFDEVPGITYQQGRRRGEWIACRLFTEARP